MDKQKKKTLIRTATVIQGGISRLFSNIAQGENFEYHGKRYVATETPRHSDVYTWEAYCNEIEDEEHRSPVIDGKIVLLHGRLCVSLDVTKTIQSAGFWNNDEVVVILKSEFESLKQGN